MRIAHVSDTHLGYSAFGRVDEQSGLNLREVDFYRAFEECVDKVIQLKPDALLHSGDLFDSVRPSNRALSFTLDQFARVSQAGIPVVVIAGNHSTPKLRETGSVFKVFEHLKDVHPVFKGEYESIELGGLMVHALPHCEGEVLQREAEKMRPSGSHLNAGMIHVGIASIQEFRMGEFNELMLPVSALNEKLDYIALGHYHGFVHVTRNATYSGSTERLSFSEARDKKGFVMVDLAKGKKEFVPLHPRPMLDLPPIDAKRMDADELRRELKNKIESHELDGKLVRLIVRNVTSPVYRAIDHAWLRSATAKAMHFDARFEVVQEGVSLQSASTYIDSLEKEFVSFLDHYPVEKVDKERLRSKGLEYLQRGLEESD